MTRKSFMLISSAFSIASSTFVVAQTPVGQGQYVEYSAKFVCGTPTVTTAGFPMVAPAGTYFTTINIHNPQISLTPATPPSAIVFLKKVVISQMEGPVPVAPTSFQTDKLSADFSEEVDCGVIRRLAANNPLGGLPFIEGFVVLYIPPGFNPTTNTNELDVVGVYTVQNGQGTSVSIEMLPVPPRFILGPLPTGAAAALARPAAEKRVGQESRN